MAKGKFPIIIDTIHLNYLLIMHTVNYIAFDCFEAKSLNAFKYFNPRIRVCQRT